MFYFSSTSHFQSLLQVSARIQASVVDIKYLIPFSQFPPTSLNFFSSKEVIMESFNQTTEFMYNPNNTSIDDAAGNSEFSGILEIYVHHARNIHNICIYDKQDVYAKFSLTYNPDETLSTRIVNGGGKNPDFNQSLIMKITQLDAVLKCEIWMLSRARNFLEDQLLGFALVPVSLVKGKGKVIQEFSLSSTDLFHSPAGTVKLSLSLSSSSMPHVSSSFQNSIPNSSISSEVVLLDRKVSDIILDPIEFSRIEFPEINVVRENQRMVSQYFSAGYQNYLVGPGSFLHLGACPPQPADDYEMACNSSEDNREGSISPDGQTSTTTSLSDDRNSSRNSIDHTIRLANEKSITIVANQTPSISPETPTSRTGITTNHGKNIMSDPEKTEEVKQEATAEKVFPAPLGIEAEQSAMQQQIVDMYMRSMQQFTESLAKMKLPMDMAKPKVEESGEVIQNHSNNIEADTKKKDGSRVFYGSRAFF